MILAMVLSSMMMLLSSAVHAKLDEGANQLKRLSSAMSEPGAIIRLRL
jgi:hypothetical protein